MKRRLDDKDTDEVVAAETHLMPGIDNQTLRNASWHNMRKANTSKAIQHAIIETKTPDAHPLVKEHIFPVRHLCHDVVVGLEAAAMG